MRLLTTLLERLGIHCTEEQVQIFAHYADLLKKWSRAYNLTAISDDREVLLKHFLDSLLYLKMIPPGARTLLDVGSGAGFPGVPIKIMRPELLVFLLEPSRKKAFFLKNLALSLSLSDVSVLQCRIEDYPCSYRDAPEVFDVIVTRALFSLEEYLEKAERLCGSGGVLIASRGPSQYGEIEKIRRHDSRILSISLPEYGLSRHLVAVTSRRFR